MPIKKFSSLFLFFALGVSAGALAAQIRQQYAPRFFGAYFHAKDNTVFVAPPSDFAVPILVYHSIRPATPADSPQLKKYSVEPEMFERQLQYLKDRGYAVISFGILADSLSKNAPLPEKSVVLTLDDGWENQYAYAFPILKKYGDTATFFIFTNAVGHRHFMTGDQIKNLADSGMEIGAHTRSHPYLTKISDPQKLADEVGGGKKIIEDHVGRPVRIFAYPFGQYDSATIAAVRDAGYLAARTIHRGMNFETQGIYTLKGAQVQNSMESLIAALGGW